MQSGRWSGDTASGFTVHAYSGSEKFLLCWRGVQVRVCTARASLGILLQAGPLAAAVACLWLKAPLHGGFALQMHQGVSICGSWMVHEALELFLGLKNMSKSWC